MNPFLQTNLRVNNVTGDLTAVSNFFVLLLAIHRTLKKSALPDMQNEGTR